MQYDSMQSLLGTILFAIALFLLTTIVVYHVYFTVLHLGVSMVPYLIGVVYSWLHCFPIGSLARRVWKPELFTGEIFLEQLPCTGSSGADRICVTRVGVRAIGYGSIVRDHCLGQKLC